MDKIIKYSDYELNEGVRDLMTPKSPERIKTTIEIFLSLSLNSKYNEVKIRRGRITNLR